MPIKLQLSALLLMLLHSQGTTEIAPPVATCASVSWMCKSGWVCKDTIDGPECVDYDECMHGTHNCENGCINTPGSYMCLDHVAIWYSCATWDRLCHVGYECKDTLSGPDCVDINECVRGTHDCDDGQYCLNTPGNFFCMNLPKTCENWGYNCLQGYECQDKVTGPECVDVNECARGTDDCEGPCVNTEGSYRCLEFIPPESCATVVWNCLAGYRCEDSMSGPECVDINECADGTHTCPEDSMCFNTKGSYTCLEVYVPSTCATVSWACKEGFECVEGNPPECVDINECQRGTDDCEEGTCCMNYQGGFVCVLCV